MEEAPKNQNQKVISVEQVVVSDTAHQISTDSWLQAAFVLTTGINSAYVLGYSGTMMVPLGWIGGVIGILLATVMSLHANCLLAKLHKTGGKRHIRYRELAGFVYGRKAYVLTWTLQYVNLFMINCGYIILAGYSLKATYVLFRDDHIMKLPYFIIMAGFLCAVFAIAVPHLSALGIWLILSTFLSVIYIAVVLVLAVNDGIKSEPRDYTIHGTSIGKVFTITGATASLVATYNTGMLPEIQATVREPVIRNMIKALYFQFTAGNIPMYTVTFVGYWAYGASTTTYLLNNTSGPVWIKALANVAAFLQSVISLHIFASPSYEYMDTKFGVKGSALAPRNLCFRILARGGYLAISTLMSALLPFLDDFMNLIGSLSTFPLTFVLANHMYLRVQKAKLTLMEKAWYWFNVVLFGVLCVASAISAVRVIIVHSRTFHLFADK